MKLFPKLLFLITILFVSCDTKQLFDNKQIAEEIASEIGGKSATFGFEEFKSSNPSNNKKYIELNVDGSEYLIDTTADKIVLASYCATQLFKRLDPGMINKYDGININFDNENDINNQFKYYFDKKELDQAWKAFDNIDNYLNFIKNNNIVTAWTFIDTNYYFFNVDSINKAINILSRSATIGTAHAYKRFEYVGKTTNKKMQCFGITTRITKSDKTIMSIIFVNPVIEVNNKIIDIYEVIEGNGR